MKIDYLYRHKEFKKVLEKELDRLIEGKINQIRIKNIPSDIFCEATGCKANDFNGWQCDWWGQELPTQEEMDNGIRNLERVGNKVDYIITHSPSASVIALLGHGLYEQDVLTKYLEDIRSKVEYKKHFCGHMHVNKAVNEKDIILYEQIIRLA